MKEYNGHRSWNAWNVCLWIGNDEALYGFAMDCIKEAKRVCKNGLAVSRLAARAARYFMTVYAGSRTPDNAQYNHLSVKLCMDVFLED